MAAIDPNNLWRQDTPGSTQWPRSPRPAAANKYFMVSADCHVQEPNDFLSARMDKKYQERLPGIVLGGDGSKLQKTEGFRPIRIGSFTLEGDSTRWLGRTTAREMATMLEGILNAKYASKLSSEVMVGMLRRQFYASRLPQRIQFRASVAHKTGDWPPIAGNDVGIIFYPGGPSIVSVFTNQNTGDFFELESTLGRIAERVVDTWK